MLRLTMSNHCQKKNCQKNRRLELTLERHKSMTYNVIPLFLPFAGCPHRCIFCAQEKQTGQNIRSGSLSLSDSLAKLFSVISALKKPSQYALRDVGFYGGTFTMLPKAEQLACLALGRRCKELGLIHGVRCSTRPDALTAHHLEGLKKAGLDLIEIGVQSFTSEALAASRRGYDGADAVNGCLAARDAGFDFGIQLLPGMPGSTPETFMNDVRQALALKPACLRFYPCLVIDGTPLAESWRRGLFAPWDTPTTTSTLGSALAEAWRADIPVIRLSLAPEPELERAVLAGPRHPALGSLIQAEALFLTLSGHIASEARPPDRLLLPKTCQGFFFGHRGSLRDRWMSIGVDPSRVVWTSGQTELIWEIPTDQA